MKGIFTVLLAFCFVVVQAQPIGLTSNYINEERFIHINGIGQWVTIKGDSTKPVVLFLHGGPGSPLSPSANAIYGQWEKEYTLVQWDQRGSGRTFGANAPEELTPAYLRTNPLTLEQMTADGIELTKYLLKYLNKTRSCFMLTSAIHRLSILLPQTILLIRKWFAGHKRIKMKFHLPFFNRLASRPTILREMRGVSCVL